MILFTSGLHKLVIRGEMKGNGEVKNYHQTSSEDDTTGDSEYRRQDRLVGDD